MKAFAYLRVSGKGQIDGDGFTRQQTVIDEYAEKNDIEILETFQDEGVSGTLADRPELAKMLISLELNGHGAKTIIIERLDRLARDLMVQETILSDLQKHDIQLISVHDGEDLTSNNPTRKLIRQVLGAVSEYDKTMTVLKLRVARERKRAKYGKCEGRKSYKEVAPEVIKEIRRLRRKRKGIKRMTFEKVAEELNQQGLSTASGGLFTGNNVSTLMHRLKV